MTITIQMDSKDNFLKMNKNNCTIAFNDKEYPCPISMAMDVIGGRWKGVILYYLMEGEKRFSELRKDMPSVTEMTLSLQLKKLESDGLIHRVVEGEKPPLKVTYSLTPLGQSLSPILQSLGAWSLEVADKL